ncbi:MAG TPA: amidohydrolase family protein [Ramlibacter sp.]|uniref:amidohydrolase family protein n=1 Tax=Ramlibacter sp. TaxID=1917967 RepID=UPI002ED15150
MRTETPSLPAHACDCHAHVFEPARFAYATQRAYTPPAADARQLKELHRGLGVERVVLVQPSVYGTDNACLLDALKAYGADQARGVAVVDLAAIADDALRALHEGGVRGARLNLHVSGGGLDAARQQVERARRLRALPGWSLQVHAGLDLVVALLDDLRGLEVPVVLDHYAGGLLPDPASEDLLAHLLAELRRGHLYVKLSAPYRLWSGAGMDHAARLAREFHAAAPDRILWGSDWPHTGGSGHRGGAQDAIEPFRSICNDQVLRELLACLPDEDACHRLLVRNPAALYGFDA